VSCQLVWRKRDFPGYCNRRPVASFRSDLRCLEIAIGF
jgi:hypothetical protein